MKKILLTITIVSLLTSCINKRKITDDDLVLKCVIVKMSVKQSDNTLQPYPYFVFETDCGTNVVSNNIDNYDIGDTITYIYVNQRNK
jgi:hypothetical protein